MVATVWLGGMEARPLTILSLQVGSLPASVFPSQIGALDIVQARAKWPKWQHFISLVGLNIGYFAEFCPLELHIPPLKEYEYGPQVC